MFETTPTTPPPVGPRKSGLRPVASKSDEETVRKGPTEASLPLGQNGKRGAQRGFNKILGT